MKTLWLLVAITLALTVYSGTSKKPPAEQSAEESTTSRASVEELEWLSGVLGGERTTMQVTDSEWETIYSHARWDTVTTGAISIFAHSARKEDHENPTD